MLRLAIVASIGAAALVGPAANAGGAVFHAYPDGGEDFPCGPSDRCSLLYAVEQASGTDEVIVEPGLHDLGSETLETSIGGAVNVHGRRGRRTRVTSTNNVTVTLFGDGRLADLQIDNADPGGGQAISTASGAFGQPSIERVRAFSAGADPTCTSPEDPGFMRDTLCLNTGGGLALRFSIFAGAPLVTNHTLTNVTAIADSALSPAAIGALFEAAGQTTMVIDASNSIIRGGPAAADISASASGSSTVTVTLESSNYAVPISGAGATITPAGDGTNQIGTPRFADSEALDYRQLANSPTINRGAADPLFGELGSFDFQGERRRYGPRPDIGADEFTGILELKARKRQRAEELRLKATCPLARCRVRATADGYQTDRARLKTGKPKALRLGREGTEPDAGSVKVKVKARDSFGGRETARARIKLR